MSEPGRSPRKMAVAAITAVTLVLFGIVLGNVHARLVRVERSVHSSSEQTPEWAQLSSRYASLAKEVEALKAVPPADSETSIVTFKADWEPRLSALEDGALAFATVQDLAQLTERVETVETRVSRVLRKPASPAAPSAAGSTAISLPAKLDPPFVPLGIELRGGERFLSILPANASSIAAARVLRPGDREGSWILERLDRDAAQFRVDGQPQRLSVPQ